MALHAARLSLPVDRRRQSLISTLFVLERDPGPDLTRSCTQQGGGECVFMNFCVFSEQVQQGGSWCSEVGSVSAGGGSRCSEVGAGAMR